MGSVVASEYKQGMSSCKTSVSADGVVSESQIGEGALEIIREAIRMEPKAKAVEVASLQ